MRRARRQPAPRGPVRQRHQRRNQRAGSLEMFHAHLSGSALDVVLFRQSDLGLLVDADATVIRPFGVDFAQSRASICSRGCCGGGMRRPTGAFHCRRGQRWADPDLRLLKRSAGVVRPDHRLARPLRRLRRTWHQAGARADGRWVSSRRINAVDRSHHDVRNGCPRHEDPPALRSNGTAEREMIGPQGDGFVSRYLRSIHRANSDIGSVRQHADELSRQRIALRLYLHRVVFPLGCLVRQIGCYQRRYLWSLSASADFLLTY